MLKCSTCIHRHVCMMASDMNTFNLAIEKVKDSNIYKNFDVEINCKYYIFSSSEGSSNVNDIAKKVRSYKQ